MVLNQSLIKYLKQKELNKITVKELCLDADVNRSTYYAHFTDPYDQLTKLKAELIQGLAEYVNKLDCEHLPPNVRLYELLKSVLQYIETQKDIFRILLAQSQNREQQLDILGLLSKKGVPAEKAYKYDDQDRHYMMLYVSTGCFGMFYSWLMDEHPMDSDRLARLMADFSESVLS